MRRRRPIVQLVLAMLLTGASVAGAAGVVVKTGLLATGSKTLTKVTCTLTGTSSTTDTYVNEANTSQNNGAVTSLVVQNTSGQRRQVLISFAFSTCPSPTNLDNAGVDAATLSLNFSSSTGSSGTPRLLKVYRVTSSWTGSTSWSSKPSWGAASTATITLSSSSPGAKSADVTQDVNDYLQSSPTVLPPYGAAVPNYGWSITDEGGGTGVSTIFSANAPTNRPTLTIDYAY
jgi:hypothetical protein